MTTFPQWRRRQRIKRWAPVVLLFGVALLSLSLMGCPRNLRTEGGDVHLAGQAGELFRKLTGANAITVNDRTAIYGSESPPSAQLRCHEETHKAQARMAAYQLLHPRDPAGNELPPLIDDDPESRTMAWVAIYAVDYVQYGYVKNRWEREAREACKDVQ